MPEPRPIDAASECGSRGQTTMDFAAGVSIFLVTVAFAFAFIPGIISPFSATDAGNPVTANRIADELAADRLAGVDSPYTLNETATVAFFTNDADLTDRLPVKDYQSVRVTLEDDSGPITISGEPAVAGDSLPDSEDVTVAWRVVTFRGARYELVVRVW